MSENVLNVGYDMMMLRLGDLIIGADYQRTISKPFVKEIVRNFCCELVHPISVSDRGSEGMYVWDGQHRVVALLDKFGPDIMVPSLVYHGLSLADEARLFSLQEAQRKLRSYEIYHAKVLAQDPDIVEIDALINAYGYCMAAHVGDHKISAAKTMIKIYTKYGADILGRLLVLVDKTWEGKKEYLKQPAFLRGLAEFISHWEEELDEGLFQRIFGVITISQIVLESKLASSNGHPDYYNGLLAIYNRNTRRKLR